jgi:hypothetical protein
MLQSLQGASKMLEQTSGVHSPHQNKESIYYAYTSMSALTFTGTAQQRLVGVV